MHNRFRTIDRIIEAEVYLYVIFIFLTKGEGVRNVLLFSSFLLWLLTVRQRGNIGVLKNPVSMLLWGFMATVLISVVSSIDPIYSLYSLREPFKSVVFFCLLTTVLSDEARLRRFIRLSYLILLFTLFVGYYSYLAHDLPVMKPDIPLRHAWHNRFAADLNTLLPFSIVLLLLTKEPRFRVMILVTILAGVVALVLSTSRGGAAAFISMVVVWSIYVSRKKGADLRVVLPSLILVFTLIGTVSYHLSPKVRERVAQVVSLRERTRIWIPLLQAVSERPVFGWGYGSRIFKTDRPFENTPSGAAPVREDPRFRNPHNTFLRILFHQGAAGLSLYVLLLFAAIRTFLKRSHTSDELRGYVLVACTGILIGTFLVHGLVANFKLSDLVLVLGIGLAAVNMGDEDSHS